MALTDMLRMSYEPPRKGLPPTRERRVACGEAGDAPFGLPSSTKVRRTATIGAKKIRIYFIKRKIYNLLIQNSINVFENPI